jgi:Putative Actinobacterial Holin-X, holin superfamily III
MAEDGTRPAATAEKQLGEIVGEVTQKAQLLVREEIELARAEITQKISRIVKGSVAFSVAAFFALLMVIFGLHTLALGLADWFSLKTWVGYGITAVGLLLLTLLAALIGVRLIRRGTPPKPELAIEEAQATKAALEEARS